MREHERNRDESMNKQIIMPNIPGMGLISLLSKPYDELTDEFIQRWLYQLYNDHLIDPEYLFVNEKGKREVHRIMESMQGYRRPANNDLVSRYVNQTTGTPMYIVTLLTSPDNLLLVGNLVL